MRKEEEGVYHFVVNNGKTKGASRTAGAFLSKPVIPRLPLQQQDQESPLPQVRA